MRTHKAFLSAFIALFVVKFIITMHSGGASQLPYVIDDAALSLGVLMIFVVLITNQHRFDRTMATIAISVAIATILCMIEYQMARPILSELFDVKIDVSEKVLSGRTRADAHRIQGLFNSPLSLAEFVALSLPAIIYSFMTSKGFPRAVFLFSLAGAIWLIFASGSRSAAAAAGAILLSYPVAFNWNKMSIYLKIIFATTGTVFLLWAVTNFAIYMHLTATQAGSAEYWHFDDTERSTVSRARQYVGVLATLEKTNYLGLGVRGDYINIVDDIDHLDSYYLRLLLEGGAPALVLFMLMVLFLSKTIARQLREHTSTDARHKHALITGTLLAFITMKVFVSMPANNVYFFVVAGSYIGFFITQGRNWRTRSH